MPHGTQPRTDGFRRLVWDVVGQCAFRRSASLLLPEASRKESFRTRRRFGRFAFTCLVAWQNSGAHTPRERICFSPLPLRERGKKERGANQRGERTHATEGEHAGLAVSISDDAQVMEPPALSATPRLCGASAMQSPWLFPRLQKRALPARALLPCPAALLLGSQARNAARAMGEA